MSGSVLVEPQRIVLASGPEAAVRFAGLRAREGALTHGQLNILKWIEDAPEAFDTTLGSPMVFPDGTRLADVVESFATLIARYEGLRTVFTLGDQPRQRVLGSGVLPIATYQVEPGTPEPVDRHAVAAELEHLWRPGLACRPEQLPIWVVLAVRDGQVLAGHVRLSHLVVDLQAVTLLGRDFFELLGDPAARVAGPPRHQPVDQAIQESEPRLRRRVDRALRYRRELLRRMPACLYPAPRGTAVAESVAVELRSPAAALALRRQAARTGRSRPSAVLAAVCALLAQRTGSADVVFPTLASNRFERHLHGHIGTLVQTVLTRVEVGTADFDELVRRAWLSVVAASERGIYDVDRRVEIDREVGSERGVHFSFEPLFNSPVVDRADDRPPPTAEQVRAALAATTVSRQSMRRTLTLLRFDLFEYDDVLHLRLWTGDTGRLSADVAESLLRAVERLLVLAADGDLDHTRLAQVLAVPPPPSGPDWSYVDSSWVELPEMQRMLTEVFGAGRARIFPERDGRQLVAYVAASESVATPEQAHAACLAALPGRHTAVAPRHYVLFGAAPHDPTDPAGWHPPLAEGSGRGA
ncbi:condensation domain-containing protein [Micromonospora sp. WMMD1102]|uniref:condensation domain-containing protein n=1 Tax=Micromonospora sp. WMMD1102 TaxID=3016105 RepID=UPI0024158E44|nr:condensation domain-containing protein [Micromonospora sp. WMMD1102]MDG4785089.1 condensation domain-containing protein [Micromonospora sp. WMMD1102]